MEVEKGSDQMTESNRSLPLRLGSVRDAENWDDCDRGSSHSEAVVIELSSLNKLRLLLLLQSLDEIEGVALLAVNKLSTLLTEDNLLLEDSSDAGVTRREDLLRSEEVCCVSRGGKLSARDLVDFREEGVLWIIELTEEGIRDEDL